MPEIFRSLECVPSHGFGLQVSCLLSNVAAKIVFSLGMIIHMVGGFLRKRRSATLSLQRVTKDSDT
jgi:hypothetical protein